MDLRRKQAGSRRSRGRRANTRQQPVDLMQLLRRRSRYRPYSVNRNANLRSSLRRNNFVDEEMYQGHTSDTNSEISCCTATHSDAGQNLEEVSKHVESTVCEQVTNNSKASLKRANEETVSEATTGTGAVLPSTVTTSQKSTRSKSEDTEESLLKKQPLTDECPQEKTQYPKNIDNSKEVTTENASVIADLINYDNYGGSSLSTNVPGNTVNKSTSSIEYVKTIIDEPNSCSSSGNIELNHFSKQDHAEMEEASSLDITILDNPYTESNVEVRESSSDTLNLPSAECDLPEIHSNLHTESHKSDSTINSEGDGSTEAHPDIKAGGDGPHNDPIMAITFSLAYSNADEQDDDDNDSNPELEDVNEDA